MRKLEPYEILILRTCQPNGTSHGGFKWPMSGQVEAPDWQDTIVCGHGLHGLPWGVGGSGYLSWNDKANNGWVAIVDTRAGGYRHGTGELQDKCKFQRAEVVLANVDREECCALLQKYAPQLAAINWSTQTAGYASTQTAGDESTQTAGYASTQKAGDESTQKAGYESTQTAGYASTQTAGDESTQTAGDESTQTAGYASTQKAGKNSAQVVIYYDNGWHTKTRVVLEEQANKWWKFENDDWRICTDAEADEAERKTK